MRELPAACLVEPFAGVELPSADSLSPGPARR